jgi:tetratricopeptide (TPR) repeat protein
MFDLLYTQEKVEESYEVLRRLVGIFPDNVERLKLVIRMAVKTGNFYDLLTWYEVYEGQDEKPEEVQKHVCAALSIFGRYLLMTQKNEDAVKAFDRALSVGVKKEVFLTYAVESLQKYGLGDEATRLVKTHDPEFAAAMAGLPETQVA